MSRVFQNFIKQLDNFNTALNNIKKINIIFNLSYINNYFSWNNGYLSISLLGKKQRHTLGGIVVS